jgi:nitrile hydratase
MSELSPAERLAKLCALEEWLAWQLQDTRRKIGQTEQQLQAEENVGYISEQAIREGHPLGATIHRANCTMVERAVTTLAADEARQALVNDPKFFHGCEFCAPGKALGVEG